MERAGSTRRKVPENPAGKCRKRPPETAGNTCWKMLERARKCVEVCARVEKHDVFDEKMGVLENAGKCRRHPLESAGKCRGRPPSEDAGKACLKVPKVTEGTGYACQAVM